MTPHFTVAKANLIILSKFWILPLFLYFFLVCVLVKRHTGSASPVDLGDVLVLQRPFQSSSSSLFSPRHPDDIGHGGVGEAQHELADHMHWTSGGVGAVAAAARSRGQQHQQQQQQHLGHGFLRCDSYDTVPDVGPLFGWVCVWWYIVRGRIDGSGMSFSAAQLKCLLSGEYRNYWILCRVSLPRWRENGFNGYATKKEGSCELLFHCAPQKCVRSSVKPWR